MAVTLTWRVLLVKDFFNFVPPSILSGSLWLAGNSLFKAESVSIIQLQGGLLSFILKGTIIEFESRSGLFGSRFVQARIWLGEQIVKGFNCQNACK